MEIFPRHWLFVKGIQRWPVDSPHKGQWRGALMLSLSCTRINDWANNRHAGDLIRHRAYYCVIVMIHKIISRMCRVTQDNPLGENFVRNQMRCVIFHIIQLWERCCNHVLITQIRSISLVPDTIYSLQAINIVFCIFYPTGLYALIYKLSTTIIEFVHDLGPHCFSYEEHS